MKVLFGGGLNESDVPDINEAAKGSYNFELSKDSHKLIPRKPFDNIATATNTADIRGFMQLVKTDDTETTLVQSAGVVYKWDGASTFTSTGTVSATSQLRDVTWALDNYLVITDLQKLQPIQKWDGTTFGTLTTGLGSSLYAKYAIVHHGRVWLFNVTVGSTDTPHLMVASAFEDPTSYDNTNRATTGTFSTGLEAFYMLTPDLKPINAAVKSIAGDLIISTTEGSLFKLTGSDGSDYAWSNFYPGSQAVGNESMVSSGNDVIYMRKGGNIESLAATQKYGDVAADDLSRWIRSTVQDMTGAISIYDQSNQKVLFFTGSKVLVLFKDILFGGVVVGEKGEKAILSPWSVYTTTDSSGFSTSAAKYMRKPGTTDYTVYFGDSSGNIYDLNGTDGGGDAGSTKVAVVRNTRFISNIDGIDMMRSVTKGTVRYRRIDQVSFSVSLDYGDEYAESTASVTLKGAASTGTVPLYGDTIYYGGSNYYNGGLAFANKISHSNFSTVGKGPGATMTASVEDTGSWQVDWVELD